ncbi:MAG: SRPBCC domain-containing protein [Fibrobacteria bacterium]
MESLRTPATPPLEKTAALVVKRTMPYPPEVLYKAFSDPKIMSQWFFGGKGWSSEVSNDFRQGGAFAIAMRSEKGEVVPHQGIYQDIVPGEKLVFTWNSPYAKDTVVTLLFRKVNEGTELSLTHEFLLETQRENHRGGWNTCLDNLELHFKQ